MGNLLTSCQIMNNYYVYVHKKRTDGKIFYVGKGIGNRCFVKFGRNKHWHNTVNKHGYLIEILKSGMTLVESLIYERETIEKLKNNGLYLCNQTNGGDGYPGFVINDETKEKFRLAKLGKKQSPEHAKKSAIARLGKKNKPESTERTISLKRKKIISSDGICFISSCHAARYLTEILGKKCYQGIISTAARGIRNHAYGISWSYDTSNIPKFKNTKFNVKRITLVERGIVFESVREAQKYIESIAGIKANNQCISESARSNGKKSSYGFHWKYS